MRRALKTTVLAGVVALGSLVWGATPAHAQSGFYGHHHGYHHGGYYSRGYHYGGVYAGGYGPAYGGYNTYGYNVLVPGAYTYGPAYGGYGYYAAPPRYFPGGYHHRGFGRCW